MYNAGVKSYLKDRYGPKLQTKHGEGQGGAFGTDKKGLQGWSRHGDGCNGLPMGPPTATYTAGQEMEVVIPVHAEHGGEYEFRLCTKKWDLMSEDKERLQCLDEVLLKRMCVPDCGCKSDKCKTSNGHKDRDDPIFSKGVGLYGAANAQGAHVVSIKIPEDVACEQCTMQWYWFTAWSEDYVSCADIKIEKAGTTPTEADDDNDDDKPPATTTTTTTRPRPRPRPVRRRRRSPGGPRPRPRRPPVQILNMRLRKLMKAMMKLNKRIKKLEKTMK
jgi:hypothetical protein